MAEAVNTLPPGFVLDQPAGSAPASVPALPPGFQLDPEQAPVASPVEQPSTATDILKSLGSGIVRGNAELGMLPVTIKRAGDAGAASLMESADSLVRSIFGLEPRTEEDYAKIRAARDASPAGRLDNWIFGGQDAIRGTMDENLHEPETTTGEYARTVGEFMQPGIAKTAVEKGLGPMLSRVLGEAAVPGVASEAAGQVTAGTPLEPYARVGGALAGNAASVLPRAYNTPETVLRRAVGPADAVDWERALRLQDNATGIKLSGPEAIAQAQSGATALPDLLRVVEGSLPGRQAMSPFFAARQAQVDSAVNNLLDMIAPQSQTPSVLGPRAADAAGSAIDDVRKGINETTKPLYQAAEAKLVPDEEFQALTANPRFTAALERLRGNPELAPDYKDLPDNSVAILDAVSKDMFARGEALSTKTNPLYGPELAGKSSEAASDARGAAREASPEYDQALKDQTRLRRDELQPVADGPLGKIASASTTQEAGSALLPRQPLVGSENEVADAFRRLMEKDPETATQLLRQEMADRYAQASKDTQSGSHETAGIKFRNSVAGSAPQDAVLSAVLHSLPKEEAARAAPELLDVLQATGRRKAIGSATDFNAAIRGDLSVNAPVQRFADIVRSFGATAVTNAADATKRAAYGRSLSSLAEMFADPNSVQLIQDALTKTPSRGLAEVLSRTARQAPVAGRDRDDNRKGGRN